MASTDAPRVPPPSPENRRVAAGQFERANQVIATGNYDYGIELLLSCCKLDPANLIYRQALRRTEKTKFKNNMRGSWHAGVSSWGTRAKIKSALRGRDFLKVLELGERVLTRNPWDVGAQVDMAEAADALGLLDLAIWSLEQARQKDPRAPEVNRFLARLYEKRGNFTQAIALWELIRKAAPDDVEAQSKAKDLAASETIARGHYQEAVALPEAAGEATDEEDLGTGTPLEPTAAPRPKPAGSSARRKPVVAHGSRPDLEVAALSSAERGATEAARLQAKIEADPTNPNAYLQLAALHRRLDQLDQAREVLMRGLGPTGNSFDMAVELAEVEIEPFRRNLAVTEERLKEKPDDEELRKLRIRLMKEINSREMDLYRRKADRYPTEMAHRFELGVRLLRAGQTDEAIRELQAARSDPRHHWKSLLYLGHCFKSRNNWRLAKRNFEECLQNLPATEQTTRKEVLFQLAHGSAEAGDLAGAIDVGHELANIDFTYRDIGRLLDEWQAKVQRADV
jgi:tetratricopeptide (TPR) repeat protein